MDYKNKFDSLIEGIDKAQKQVILNLSDGNLEDWPNLAAKEILKLRTQVDKLNGKPTRKCGVTFLPGQGRCADT